jgi:hypothetical protein
VDEHSHYSLNPCTALWWGRGQGGASSGTMKICLNKNGNYTFLLKTSETKKIINIFCEAYFIKASTTYFHSK